MWDSIFVKIGKDMSKQIVSEKIAFEGKFIRIVNYTLSNSNSSEQHDYECMERGDSVCAIVYHPEKEKYLLVKQFRVGAKKVLVELVAGMVDKGDKSHEEAIKREIEEELGYEVIAGSMRLLYDFYSTPGACSEKMFLYYAEVDKQKNNGGGVDDEEIEIIEYTADELLNISQFEDAKTIMAAVWVNS